MTPPATAYTDKSGCRNCGASLKGRRVDAQFCTNACRYAYHNKTKTQKENARQQTGAKDIANEKTVYTKQKFI